MRHGLLFLCKCVCVSDSQSNERLNLSEFSCRVLFSGMTYTTVQWKTDLASALTGCMYSVLVMVYRPEASFTELGIIYVSEKKRGTRLNLQ